MNIEKHVFRGEVVGFTITPDGANTGPMICFEHKRHIATVKCPATAHLSLEDADKLAEALALAIQGARFYRTNQEGNAVEEVERYLEATAKMSKS